jgi:K+-sensing histidine kinase KdpD
MRPRPKISADLQDEEPAVSDQLTLDEGAPSPISASDGDADGGFADELTRAPLLVRYGLSLVFVVLAVVLAFVVEHLIAPPNLSLIFVLPVVAAATLLGWGPSLIAGMASVLAYDFFFTEPRYSLRIASSSDIWATALLLVIAAIVSTLAAEARRRALEARRAADQALALQALAHVVIESRPAPEVLQAAATALNRIFQAPAVIFAGDGAALHPVAKAGRPKVTLEDEEAAKGALDMRHAARAETYPYDQSAFDLWPVISRSGARYVLGVNFGETGRGRPLAPERLVEIVGAYLAAALGRTDAGKPAPR